MEATLGKRITAHRKRLGLTQDQLAEKLGLTAQAVSKWENDLSCPDIGTLPKLADIFGITIDELMGREAEIPVCETQVVTENETEDDETPNDNDKFVFQWDGGRKNGIGLACWVLVTGVIYLLAQLVPIDVSLWNILWPSFLLVFGIFGLFPRFSAFRLGCALAGGYFLIDKLHIFSITLNKGVLLAIWVLLFGLFLLSDALKKKNNKPHFHVNYTDKNGNVHHGKRQNDYSSTENSFSYSASFGDSQQMVMLEKLKWGQISTSFGDFTVDLSGVEAVEPGCHIKADCSFGEQTILVPRCFSVNPNTSTSLAAFDIKGSPDSAPKGTIYLEASVSFGEIVVRYL